MVMRGSGAHINPSLHCPFPSSHDSPSSLGFTFKLSRNNKFHYEIIKIIEYKTFYYFQRLKIEYLVDIVMFQDVICNIPLQ